MRYFSKEIRKMHAYYYLQGLLFSVAYILGGIEWNMNIQPTGCITLWNSGDCQGKEAKCNWLKAER